MDSSVSLWVRPSTHEGTKGKAPVLELEWARSASRRTPDGDPVCNSSAEYSAWHLLDA